jgi:hypothetical protein
MGYEIKLFVGDLVSGVNGKHALDVVSMIDLCKVDTPVYELKFEKGLPIYFYDTDGNSRVEFDRYDRELVALPIEQVINAIETAQSGNTYRRYEIALSTLKSIQQTFHAPYVVVFGH